MFLNGIINFARTPCIMNKPRWLSSKESACNAGDAGDTASVPGKEGQSPGGGNDNSLQYSCWEKSHGQAGLARLLPGDRKEPDTTERLNTHTKGVFHQKDRPSSSYSGFTVVWMGSINDKFIIIEESGIFLNLGGKAQSFQIKHVRFFTQVLGIKIHTL